MKKIAVLAIVLFASLAVAGEKEDLAVKIFVLQEEVQILQDQIKAKQATYQKAKELMKKEKNAEAKGRMAVDLLKQEDEIIAIATRLNAKSQEHQDSRAKFKEIAEK